MMTELKQMINTVRHFGIVETYNDKGKLHSFDNKHALEFNNGDKYWYKKGRLHRIDGPAIEYSNGTKKWFKEGKLHRLDGPSVEYSNGGKEWWKEGLLYRVAGHACEY